MADTMPHAARLSHRVIPETPCSMLKADVRKAETDDRPETADWRRAVGEVVEHARRSMGWTLDELASAFEPKKDPRQIARWERGEERPQFDLLLALPRPSFRQLLIIGFAQLGGDAVVIETQIRIKR